MPAHLACPALEQHAIHSERLSLYIGRGHALFDRKAVRLADLAGVLVAKAVIGWQDRTAGAVVSKS